MKRQAEQPFLRSRLVQLGLRVSGGFLRANNLDLLTHITATESVSLSVRMKS